MHKGLYLFRQQGKMDGSYAVFGVDRAQRVRLTTGAWLTAPGVFMDLFDPGFHAQDSGFALVSATFFNL